MPLTLDDVTFPSREAHRPAVEPFTLVVFGASGDLAHRKLLPALCALDCDGHLPAEARIVGYGRSDMTDESFRREIRKSASLSCDGSALSDKQWDVFSSRLFYSRGQYDSAADFQGLHDRITEMGRRSGGPANRLFYLATPPGAFVPIVRSLAHAGLARECGGPPGPAAPWSRIIIEKPFGRDLQSSRALNAEIRQCFHERQIFRIDHFLGKETVQNLMVLRFANSIFEPIWNQKYLDHVQITVAETLGAEGRGGYYDQAGAIRDIVQNHMMHLLCMVAMEPPASLDADSVRNEKVKVLKALRRIEPRCAASGVVRGQYTAGVVDGRAVPGYRQLEGVAPDSTTETFVAFKAFVDNWRWSGVPFFLRTGKRLPERRTTISIHFRQVPQVLFNTPPTGPVEPNVLAIRVQPNEGISMEFQVKAPGMAMHVKRLKMDFSHAEAFGSAPPEAYQRLLLDAALGDQTLFTRDDEVEAAWEFVSPVLEGCRMGAGGNLAFYEAGTWGPKEALDLIAEEGNRWHLG
jgi:glucose-6-phosphate 1-dehydrogenase